MTDSTSLFSVGRRYWLFFIPAWVYPLAFLTLFTIAPGFVEMPVAPLVWGPVFLLSFGLGCAPWLLGWVKQRYVMFWVAIVPLLIWVIAVVVQLTVFAATGRNG
jgi:hypothetical protein